MPSVAVLAVAAGGVLFGAGALLSVGGGVDMDSAHALSAAVLVTLGYALGRRAVSLVDSFERYAGAVTLVVAVVVVVVVLVRRRRAA